jgi:hypothetical protein
MRTLPRWPRWARDLQGRLRTPERLERFHIPYSASGHVSVALIAGGLLRQPRVITTNEWNLENLAYGGLDVAPTSPADVDDPQREPFWSEVQAVVIPTLDPDTVFHQVVTAVEAHMAYLDDMGR